MTAPPERFAQKRSNFAKALEALTQSLAAPVERPRDLSGIVKDFEIVYELAWTTLKVFIEGQGHATSSARDTFSKAYQLDYIDDEEVWLDMIAHRNLTVHTYNAAFAEELSERIRSIYFPALQSLQKVFDQPI